MFFGEIGEQFYSAFFQRILREQYHQNQMPQFQLSSITPKEIAKGYTARFIHTEHMTFSYLDVKAGSTIAEHSHPNEQVCHIFEGTFQLTVNGEEIIFKPGTVITIPPNVKHAGLAITDCKLMDVFYPVRDDYKKLI